MPARAIPTDSATMRLGRWSSRAMLAKYTGWVPALGSRAGENEVKRTAGGQERETVAEPPAADVPPRPADRRRTPLRGLQLFGSERLTGALLDRLTHHVHILEMNGDSYRIRHSRQSAASQVSD